jgi:CPA1 family monovalent cation:H+ antiporter
VILGAVAITAVGRRWIHQSSLIVVVVAGAVSFIPALPRVELEPHLIFSLVMPPLLYSAARQFSLFSFMRHVRAIMALGVGLVVVTTAAITGLALWIAPALGASGALILAAVVSPPDTVTTVTHGRAIGLPRRVVEILTGECLINDAAALTIFAVAASQVTGDEPVIANPVVLFIYSAAIGVLVGVLASIVTSQVALRLPDDSLATALTVLLPFVAYLAAEEVHASGVLAVVAAGFTSALNATFDERAQGSPLAYRLRVRELEVWPVVDVLLEAFVFAYMGLQLRHVITELAADAAHIPLVIGLAAAVLVAVMAVRAGWVFLTFGRWTLAYRWRARRAARGGPRVRARMAALEERQRLAGLRADRRREGRLERIDQRVDRAESVAARRPDSGPGRAAHARAVALRAQAVQLRQLGGSAGPGAGSAVAGAGRAGPGGRGSERGPGRPGRTGGPGSGRANGGPRRGLGGAGTQGRRGGGEPMGWQEMLLVSWTGMRGIVTLAVAAEVPGSVGAPGFPGRSVIQAVAFAVAIGTLLIQGSTLGFLARRLGIDLSGEDAAASDAMVQGKRIAEAVPAAGFEARRTAVRAAVLRGELDDQTATRILRGLDFEEAARDT